MSKAGVAKTLEYRKPRKRVRLEDREINGVMVTGKKCTYCGEWKPLECYCVSKQHLGGRLSRCKECDKIYRENNKDRKIEYMRAWRRENRTYTHQYEKSYRYRNIIAVTERHKRWKEQNKDRLRLYKLRRRAKSRGLPSTLTTEQRQKIWQHFGNRCALTGCETIHQDHAIPIATGHGGSIYGNIYPLRGDLNQSKNDENIFEWFEANRQRFKLSKDRFNRLIEWLANANGLTVDEYRDFVYWCHANPRSIDEIEADKRPSIEIWRESLREREAITSR